MAHTEREVLDRLAEDRPHRPTAPTLDIVEMVISDPLCDSCSRPVRQDIEPGRWRHAACPVPPAPPALAEIREQLAQRRSAVTS